MNFADLFCGAGGTSSGLLDACSELGYVPTLLAVNHWDIAIATHTASLPEAKHLNCDLEDVEPREVIKGGKLRLLVASPECIHFSNARGGRPMSKQSRASIKYVLRWITALDVEDVLVENVREFMNWGPLHRQGPSKARPIETRKGEYFNRFIAKLQSLGYRVEHRILCAADFGDATTRKRLFIRARKGNKPIIWPETSHAAPDKTAPDMFSAEKQAWHTAREILDLTDRGESIFNRKKPLSPNTMNRIFKGLEKFSGLPFIVPFFGEYAGKSPRTHDLNKPLPTVTSHGAGGIVNPFLVKFYGQNDAATIDKPLPVVTAQGNHIGVASPFVMAVRGGDDGYLRGSSVDAPLPAVTAHPALATVSPFVIHMEHSTEASGHDRRVQKANEPLPTLTSRAAFGIAQPEVEAMIVPVNHGKGDVRFHETSNPFPTITSVDAWGLAQYLVEFHGGKHGEKRSRSVNEPLPTQDTQNRFGLAQPFIVKYYKSGDGAVSIDEPLPTATGRDHFGLCIPMTDGYAIVDIFFRMVKPIELARAHSLDDFKFQGTREEVVKQIGNSVPRKLAKALCLAALRD